MSTFPLPFGDIAHLTVLPDGRVLASTREGYACSRFALLDPTDGRWEGPLEVPYWLTLDQAAVASAGSVLVTGEPAVVVSLDPFTVAPVHPPRKDWHGISVALVPDGVLVAGGFRAPSVPRTEVEAYRDGQWAALAPLPGPRWSGMGVRARSGRVVLGGRTPTVPDPFSVDVYDPTRDIWTRTRPDWAPPELPESRLAKLREIHARHGSPPEPSPEPTVAMWTSPVAMADGTVVWFVDSAGEFFTSMHTMAWLDPIDLVWSDPVPVPDYVAQVERPVVGLPDGRLVTTGWSERGGGHRLFGWSRADGWQEGPDVALFGRTPLALLPDGRVLFVAEGEQALTLVRM